MTGPASLTVEIEPWKGGPAGPPRTGGPTPAPATAAFDQQYVSRAQHVTQVDKPVTQPIRPLTHRAANCTLYATPDSGACHCEARPVPPH